MARSCNARETAERSAPSFLSLMTINLRLHRNSILFRRIAQRERPSPVGSAAVAIGLRTCGDPHMSGDVIVLGGLAAVFSWT
jgi:hypothetical protein